MSATTASDVELPTAREEAWRYTPVDEIVARIEAATLATAQRVERSIVDALAGIHGGARLVFVNGVHAPELSDQDALPAGLWCGAMQDAPLGSAAARAARLAELDSAADGFQSLNRTAGRGAAVVIVEPGVQVSDPVHVVHLSMPGAGDGTTVSHPQTIIDVGDDGRVAIVETYCGFGGRTVTNASTAITAGRRADIHRVRVQAEGSEATHIGHSRVDQAEGSSVRMISVTLGGDIARDAIDVRLNGNDARSELDGVYLTTGRQRHDTVVSVDHSASRCTSRQRFRGVIGDHGRGSFGGLIVVRHGTVGTDARQSNRNLLLSATAEADTRPWLQIHADDVRCAHGATVGRLDDDALFYLRSRGIALDDARAMLIGAFVRDITDAIPHASLRDHVAALVAVQHLVAITDPEDRP